MQTCLSQLSLVVLSILALTAPALAVEPEWRVGLAQVKVTPERPVPLSGYASRTRPFESVAADIFVKVMVLQDQKGQRGVIVTSDLIGFTAAVAEPICERIIERTGLTRDQILLNSSHTHAAPTLSLKPPADDAPDAGETLRTVDYTRALQDKVVDAVVQAASHLEPARLSWGSGVVHFAMNRREFTPNGVILGVNPRGLADRSVPVLRVDTLDGQLRAVLFGAGTHGTTLGGDNYQLCGDYAGFAQASLAERFPHVQAMFMLGCAGDSNPYPRGTMDMARDHGATLAAEVCRVLDTKLRPVTGPLHIAFKRVDLPLQSSLSREALEEVAANKRSALAWGAERMLAQIDRGEKPATFYNAPFSVWQFGDRLTLVGLPGEVVVDYVTLLEGALGPNQLWVAGYCHDVFGYLPSARILREGGYETRGLYSGGAGYFDPKAQDVVVEAVRELARIAGRKLPE
jgi:neutral ceramidase